MAYSEARAVGWLKVALMALCGTMFFANRVDAQESCHGEPVPDVETERQQGVLLPPLVDVAGATLELAELVASHQLTVLFWYGVSCPCVARYQARIEEIAQRHAPDDVVVIAVDSNADDDVDALTRSIEDRGFVLPIYRDIDAELADLLGVRSTPTVVVLDANAEVVFRGWIDNERQPGQRGREAWLEEALAAAIAGTGGGSTEAPVYGCAVTRRRR